MAGPAPSTQRRQRGTEGFSGERQGELLRGQDARTEQRWSPELRRQWLVGSIGGVGWRYAGQVHALPTAVAVAIAHS